MKSFHGDTKVKAKYLKRVRMHQKLDRLVRGTGYQNEGGVIRACAVGCTLDAYDHSRYEVELGIPEWLAQYPDLAPLMPFSAERLPGEEPGLVVFQRVHDSVPGKVHEAIEAFLNEHVE